MEARKILIFSTAYAPFWGGAEVAIKEITDRIGDLEFDLITAKFKKGLPRSEKVGRVNVYRVGVGLQTLDKLLLPFLGAIKALRLNNKNRYKFYWCMMVSFASGAAYISNIIKFWNRTPVVLTLQEGDSEEHFGKRWLGLINLSWKLALSRADKLTVISNYLGERARKFGYKGEIYLIPNGVDFEKFDVRITKNEIEERKKVRNEIGLKEGDIALVTTSRLVLKNGVGDVIDALKSLPKNVKFVIIGSGILENKLKLHALSSKLQARVIFLGFVSHDKLPKYLKACDIFIRPSLSEGMGNSFIEAMAAGLPVIATPVGGIVDFIFDGETGYFCKPNDPNSIAHAVRRVINDTGINKVLNRAAMMINEKYNWELISKKMLESFISKNRR
jgi:glycosyltransferase involved in cell wall biosynthesis